MKRLSVLLALLISCLALMMSGCTKGCNSSIGCSIEQTVVSNVSSAIATQLQCSNPTAIQTDLNNLVGKLNLCNQNPALDPNHLKLPGPICSVFANLIVNGVASVAIPSSWGCTAANAKGLLENVIVTGCQNI